MNTIQTIDAALLKVTDPVAREEIANIKKAHLEEIAEVNKTLTEIKFAVEGQIIKTNAQTPQGTGQGTVVRQKPHDRVVDFGESKRKLTF